MGLQVIITVLPIMQMMDMISSNGVYCIHDYALDGDEGGLDVGMEIYAELHNGSLFPAKIVERDEERGYWYFQLNEQFRGLV